MFISTIKSSRSFSFSKTQILAAARSSGFSLLLALWTLPNAPSPSSPIKSHSSSGFISVLILAKQRFAFFTFSCRRTYV